MCLAIPNKVVKIDGDWAIVKSENHTHKANLSLVKNVKVGDYLLIHNELALNKLPKNDALKILKFLERKNPQPTEQTSKRFNNILDAYENRDLVRDEIIYLLETKDKEKEALFSEANAVRQKFLKEFICIHGIIEFSNYCKNDCFYCGLRKGNSELKRYRMSPEEIIKTAESAVNKKGYKLLVLQSGEDHYYTDEILCDIIKKIKNKCRVFVFISVGERGYDCYKKMKKAGASGVLFRFETSNQKLFEQLHPRGKNFKNRFDHLKFMKKLGYFIATGSIIGLDGQAIEDLADDILTMKKWANMISMGPFIPTADTPLGKSQIPIFNFQTNYKLQMTSDKKVELTLKMIAVLRLMMPMSRVPVVTAFETLAGKKGRKQALFSGANSLMFNLTPAKYRPLYKIYGDKFYQKENFWEKYGLFKYEESYKMLEERMKKEIENRKTKK